LLKSEHGSNPFQLHTSPIKHESFHPTSHESLLWISILINRLSGVQTMERESTEGSGTISRQGFDECAIG